MQFKNLFVLFFILVSTSFLTLQAQSDSSFFRELPSVVLVYTNGDELTGKIISQDEREVYFLTQDGRKIYIPQYTIEEIDTVTTYIPGPNGVFVGEERFSTRYFFSTNGLPLKKGDHYVQINLFGPDFQFALDNNIGIGVITTWAAFPIILNVKKSFEINDNTHLAVGALLGTGSWTVPNFALAVPFASLSFGDRTKNIAFSAGYGNAWFDSESQGRFLGSVGGMLKVTPKISLVFDSFIFPRGPQRTEQREQWIQDPVTGNIRITTVNVTTDGAPPIAVFIPGLRWHNKPDAAFQLGFTGLFFDGEAVPVTIPMLQWYRTL